jgi:type I phosphodiesterase/nucleotide pyrophosphatase
VRSIAEADRALERIMHVAGGVDAFLEEYAVIVMSDHSQTAVENAINLSEVLADARVLMPSDVAPTEAELAACPSARSAMVYALDEPRRDELTRRAADTLLDADGVELVITRDDGTALVRSHRGELRFAPGDDLADRRGNRWRLQGDESVLELNAANGEVGSETYPDALGRLWSSLRCPHSGDVLVSAELGYEFVDWGGADHVGGGSHGSLHRDDSEGVLLLCGIEPPERDQWSLADVTPLVLQHFGVPLGG